MPLQEDFKHSRMQRCAAIHAAIFDNWLATGTLKYVLRMTTDCGPSVDYDELKKQYFTIGIGDQLADVPFIDVLVIFSMLEQENKAWRQAEEKKLAKNLHVRLEVPTAFTDDEASRLVSRLVFETRDGRKIRLRFSRGRLVEKRTS